MGALAELRWVFPVSNERLTPWPENLAFCPNNELEEMTVFRDYQRQLALAAMERLKLAVDLLESCECGSGDWCDDRDRVLAAIDMPKERT